MKKPMSVLVAIFALCLAERETAAATTNEWIGTARVLSAANQWSLGVAPTVEGNIRDWLIGGSAFNNLWASSGSLTANQTNITAGVRVYADTIYIASGVNTVHTNGGSVFDLGFQTGGVAGNRIVVKTGFDIASGVTNNVVLKSSTWVSSNANSVITFNHKGTGTLKIQNDWADTPVIALVFNGSTSNKVEFGSTITPTHTGGTTLNNISASLVTNNALASSGILVLTNGASLDLNGRNSTRIGTLKLGGTLMLNMDFSDAANEAVVFGNSAAVVWDGAAVLNLIGFSGGDTLRFGTDASGLTAQQLSQFRINGSSATFSLDANGYLQVATNHILSLYIIQ